MTDAKKTRAQLVQELVALRQEVAELKTLDQVGKQQFRDLADGSIQGIMIHRAGQPLFVNQAFAEVFGYTTSDDILRMEDVVSGLVAPHEQAHLRGYMQARQRGEPVPNRYDYQGVRQDGTPAWVSNTARMVNWEEQPAIQTTIVDITARKQAQASLQESEANFRHLVHGSIQGLFIHTDCIIQFVNPATATIFGYDSTAELMGQDYRVIVDPEEHDRVERYRQARLQGDTPPSYYECKGVKKDGQPLWFECLVSCVPWNGKLSTLSTFHDITARKQAEAALQHANETLEQQVAARTAELYAANAQLRQAMAETEQAERLAALGTFAAGVAHELNNPLGAMSITAEHAHTVLHTSQDLNTVQDCLAEILEDAQRCAQIVKRVLHFARQEAPVKAPVALHPLIQTAYRLTQRYTERQNVQVTLDLSATYPSIWAHTAEMELVFVNLIRNAVEAGCKQAQVTIQTQVAADQVQILVHDTGIGLSATEQQRVFDPFYTTRQTEGGTGLGLSIAHRIIRDHNGTITFQSTPGHGTTVAVNLPLVSALSSAHSQPLTNG